MLLRRTLRHRIAALAFLALALTLTSSLPLAAQVRQKQRQFAQSTDGSALGIAPVRTGLFLIFGGGSNSVLRLSANGLIVVDGKLPGNYDALRGQLRRISDQPVRLVINTDYHEVRTGTNANFLQSGARILAQQNVVRNLADYNARGAKIAPPDMTFDRTFTVKLGLIEADLLHFGSAHTSGDTVVYFPDLKVVAVGDLLAAKPDPDFSAGGSLIGWEAALAKILKLDFDIVVAGAGPIAARSDLEAFKTKMDVLVSRARMLVKSGASQEQLMGQLKSGDLGWRLDFNAEQLAGFYAELSQSVTTATR